ncbi:cytochrome-c oxidase [Methylomicrobium sp. Wu6]|uniref:cytochrome-c oxidase n=1 Tax=Methylomicrobium sp. Wu6 TaxID=3107928 RepID=UPI002DD634BD|nr:cytochrome-c oxidase [Methylomicrobium sp. Wu6]MEC4749441.1 cytochrome-c oxidase [Methylomicrobium sp. Wu6]
MGITFIRIAVIYLLVGVGLGIYMASSHAFEQRDTHAHANLLGWASLAISGLIYQAFPKLAGHVLAKVHFWLHNFGLPITLIGVALIYGGNPQTGEPMAGIGSSIVALSFVALLFNVFRADAH